MKLNKAIKVLTKYQQYMLGAEVKPARPKKVNEAISIVLYSVKLQKRYIKSGEIGDFEELKKL